MSQSLRPRRWMLIPAWMGIVFATKAAAQLPARTVTGKLIALTPGAVILEANGRRVSVPFSRKTSVSVTGRATADVLQKGMLVQIAGSPSVQNPYILSNASLTIYVGYRPTRTTFASNPTSSTVRVTGVVVKTKPLIVQADNSCPPVAVKFVGNQPRRLAVRGRLFQAELRPGATVGIHYGRSTRYAGKDPQVRVQLAPNGRYATSVTIERQGTITAADLGRGKKKSSPKKKKSGRKKPTGKKKTAGRKKKTARKPAAQTGKSKTASQTSPKKPQ